LQTIPSWRSGSPSPWRPHKDQVTTCSEPRSSAIRSSALIRNPHCFVAHLVRSKTAQRQLEFRGCDRRNGGRWQLVLRFRLRVDPRWSGWRNRLALCPTLISSNNVMSMGRHRHSGRKMGCNWQPIDGLRFANNTLMAQVNVAANEDRGRENSITGLTFHNTIFSLERSVRGVEPEAVSFSLIESSGFAATVTDLATRIRQSRAGRFPPAG